jgi:hypothetical protein
MWHTVDVHATYDGWQREPECREKQCFGRMAKRFAEGSRVHDKASRDTDDEEHKEHEVEDIDNDADCFESGESMGLSGEKCCETSGGLNFLAMNGFLIRTIIPL